ncbi:MAG: hypothetical protein AB8B77_09110 [Alphaproteobacteria bacterium]
MVHRYHDPEFEMMPLYRIYNQAAFKGLMRWLEEYPARHVDFAFKHSRTEAEGGLIIS